MQLRHGGPTASLSQRSSQESGSRRRAGFSIVKGGATEEHANATTDLTKLPPGFLEGQRGWGFKAAGMLLLLLPPPGVWHVSRPARAPPPSPFLTFTSPPPPTHTPTHLPLICPVSPSDIKLVECVGEGSFGEVWLAEYCGALVAVKILAKVGGSSGVHADAFDALWHLAAREIVSSAHVACACGHGHACGGDRCPMLRASWSALWCHAARGLPQPLPLPPSALHACLLSPPAGEV